MKVSKDGRPELRLRDSDVEKILSLAKSRSLRDYFLFVLTGRRGLRIGSVLGFPPKRVRYIVKKEVEMQDGTIRLERRVVEKQYSQPGLLKSDLTEDGFIAAEHGRISCLQEKRAAISGKDCKWGGRGRCREGQCGL